MKVTRDYFGMMYQGSSVHLDGSVQEPYFPIPVGVQRLWDTGATMTGMGAGPDFNLDGLVSQIALAERNQSKVLFCFGFGGDPLFPPPASALLPGSTNRPTDSYLTAAQKAVLDFSVGIDGTLPRRIHIYEAWNEPAIGSLYWAPGSPEDCYDQTARLERYVKARDPGALLLSPSFCGLNQQWGSEWAKRYVAAMKLHGPACDAVAFHIYAANVAEIAEQLTALERICAGLGLPYYCTEYGGPREAFDMMALRGIRCVVQNGQIPPAPYSSAELAQRWTDMVARLESVGPTADIIPELAERRGCWSRLNPFKR